GRRGGGLTSPITPRAGVGGVAWLPLAWARGPPRRTQIGLTPAPLADTGASNTGVSSGHLLFLQVEHAASMALSATSEHISSPRQPQHPAQPGTGLPLCPHPRTAMPLIVCRKQDSPVFPLCLRLPNMASFLPLMMWHVSCFRTG